MLDVSSISRSVELLPILDTVAILPLRRWPGGGARRFKEDRPSCSSGLLSRNVVEFAQRIETEEWAERVGEGGGFIEDPSEVGETEEVGESREFCLDRRMGVGGDRKPCVSEGVLARFEGGKRKLSEDGECKVSRGTLGKLSSCTPTTAISGMSRSSDAISEASSEVEKSSKVELRTYYKNGSPSLRLCIRPIWNATFLLASSAGSHTHVTRHRTTPNLDNRPKQPYHCTRYTAL